MFPSCQKAVLNELKLGDNIARNTALSENVFMMVVCIELRIPLFVVGKPGSSKSLAKTVVTDNMLGDASRSPLKTFKQVGVWFRMYKLFFFKREYGYENTDLSRERCFFSSYHERGEGKNSESPWGIESQTFGFLVPMLYYWATQTLWWARPFRSSYRTHFLSLCSSVVEHRSAESKGLRLVPHGHLELFLCPTLVRKLKIYFFTEL